jgi:hypothetical protein
MKLGTSTRPARAAGAVPRTALIVLTVLFGTGGTALAQTEQCAGYRAELASLNRSQSSARNLAAAAQRERAQVAQLRSYYRSIGCEQGFIFFQPAECGAIGQRIRAMEANFVALANQASDPVDEGRRRQLQAAIARFCPEIAGDSPTFRATGGSRIVCVRSCDGYFFPLQNTPRGDATAADLCHALCPNSEVSVFRAPKDGGIENAISEHGKPYMQLANALRFQQTYDPSCSCKAPGASWAQTLQNAERMIARRSSDIVVTARVAEEMFRARIKGASEARKTAMKGRPVPASDAPATDDPVATGSVATHAEPAAAVQVCVDRNKAPARANLPESQGLADAPSPPACGRSSEGPLRLEGREAEHAGKPHPRVIAPDMIPVPLTE